MLRSLKTVLSVSVLSLAIGCAKTHFIEFSPPEGGFKVLMPGTPQEMNMTVPEGPIKMYFVMESQGTYSVSFLDGPIPDNESAAKIQSRLDRCRDGQLSGIKGSRLVSESQIQLCGDYPGRDILVEIPGEQKYMHMHYFLVKKRFYQVNAVGDKSWVQSPLTNEFLDSFALLAK